MAAENTASATNRSLPGHLLQVSPLKGLMLISRLRSLAPQAMHPIFRMTLFTHLRHAATIFLHLLGGNRIASRVVRRALQKSRGRLKGVWTLASFIMFIRSGFVVVIVGVTLTSLSTVIVALRYFCRYFRMGSVGATDHLMLAALLLTWGTTTINYFQDYTSNKFSPSQFRIPEKRPMIEAAVRSTLVVWWMYRIIYGIALCFVKLSILYFYRAIASHATFRRMVNWTIGFVCLYTFASTIASVFQCDNPSDAWSTTSFLSQFDGVKGRTKPPKCYDPTRLSLFSACINMFTDVVILLLPIPTLLGLRVPMSKRLALICIFSVGLLAIVASCVRMWVMALWSQSPEKSVQFGTDLLLWGQVETNSGIISASVPFLRLVFGRKEKVSEDKRRIIGPPQPIPEDLENKKKFQIETFQFFEESEGNNGSPAWDPFITVPASLSSGSRGSGMLEPAKPHLSV